MKTFDYKIYVVLQNYLTDVDECLTDNGGCEVVIGVHVNQVIPYKMMDLSVWVSSNVLH